MLKQGNVATRLPVRDLRRAKTFYADKLGLTPSRSGPAAREGNLLAIGQPVR